MCIDSEGDLKGMRAIGRIVRLALEAMGREVREGVTTARLNEVGARILGEHGARSAPMLIYGFPAEICISVNDEIVHGIPSGRKLLAGDLVTVDVTAEKDGYIADAAVTHGIEPLSHRKRELIECAERAFALAMEAVRAGGPVNHIGRAVEKEVRSRGFRIVRALAGHGVGRAIHENPPVPNYYDAKLSDEMPAGLVIAVEPMATSGSGRVFQAPDGWTIKTRDGAPAAHYEHTVLVTEGQPELLTAA